MIKAPRSEPEPAASPIERAHRTWLWFGSIVAVLVVLTGLVWLADGFERRTDLQTGIAAGTTITTGPYELTFDSATVQLAKALGNEVTWHVVVSGTGRVTGDEAMSPSSLDWFMTARDPISATAQEPEGQVFGPVGHRAGDGQFFTPGLAPIPYHQTFDFPADITAPTKIQLGVWQLEYRDTTLLQTGELTWTPGDDYYLYDNLPTTRLPDDLD